MELAQEPWLQMCPGCPWELGQADLESAVPTFVAVLLFPEVEQN